MQSEPEVHLHRSLRDPDRYGGLPDGSSAGLDQLLRTAERAGLIAVDDARLQLLAKFGAQHEFDEVRLENFIDVYANEVEPVPCVARAALDVAATIDDHDTADVRLDAH